LNGAGEMSKVSWSGVL